MPWWPIWLCDVEDPALSRQSANSWRCDYQPYVTAALPPPPPQKDSWYSSLLEV
jgi:hypothetical protein